MICKVRQRNPPTKIQNGEDVPHNSGSPLLAYFFPLKMLKTKEQWRRTIIVCDVAKDGNTLIECWIKGEKL